MSEGRCYRHSIAPLQLCALPLQVPTVTGIGQDAALLYEAESEEVVSRPGHLRLPPPVLGHSPG